MPEPLVVLPRAYRGPVPEWPLPDPSDRELAVWAEMWTRPQAAVWAHLRLTRQVGMHVRTLVEAEEPTASASLLSVAHRQAVSLLLTPASLRRAGYRISPVEAL